MDCEVLPAVNFAEKGAKPGIEHETMTLQPACKVRETGKEFTFATWSKKKFPSVDVFENSCFRQTVLSV
jgi:hypothetical protein